MRRMNAKLTVTFIMLSVFFAGLLYCGNEAYAATSGTIPCSEGSVAWTFSDDGELIFSGNGTTEIYGRYEYDWADYWDECGIVKSEVKAVHVEEESRIYLDTCLYMFCGFNQCTSIDMTGFDTSKVVDMYGMFSACLSLTTLDVSELDTSKVDDMGVMFARCRALKSLDLSSFNTSNVQFMDEMFLACESLTSLDLSNFDTTNVGSMDRIFSLCDALKTLDISGFDLLHFGASYVLNISCDNLEKLICAKTPGQYQLSTVGESWFDDAMNFYFEDQTITLNPKTTIYRVKDSYNINYVYNGKLVNCPDTFVVADGLSQLGTVELEHYTFGGWYADEQYKTAVTSIGKGALGDITLYAKMIPNTYSITYRNTEKAVSTEGLLSKYTYGSAYKLPVLKSGAYTFAGWYLDQELTKKIDSITTTTGGNLILYAKWMYALDIAESTAMITDQTIMNMKMDGDIKGSSFAAIQARADKTTRTSIQLKWNKVKDADGYKIYGNKCGKKNSYQLIKAITNGKKTTYTKKKLKKGTYYKYIVRAYKIINGQEVTIAASKTIHVTTTGGKYGNTKSVKIKTDKKMKSKKGSYTLTIKKNKKYTIKASEVKESKKIDKHRKVAYESSNTSIATVTKKGVLKGKRKGTCYVYIYAQNGAYTKVKVKIN